MSRRTDAPPADLETTDSVTLYFSSLVRTESDLVILPSVAAAVATEFMRIKVSLQVTINMGIPPQVLVIVLL